MAWRDTLGNKGSIRQCSINVSAFGCPTPSDLVQLVVASWRYIYDGPTVLVVIECPSIAARDEHVTPLTPLTQATRRERGKGAGIRRYVSCSNGGPCADLAYAKQGTSRCL